MQTRNLLRSLSIVLLIASPLQVSVFAQKPPAGIEELQKLAPKVFLDCDSCDSEYIRTEITFGSIYSNVVNPRFTGY